MPSSNESNEIFLQPGEFYFGDGVQRLRTLLGSCVAITLWHPRLRIGGMCHYMLPTRTMSRHSDLDGRYGDEALRLFIRQVQQTKTHLKHYEIKLFGGSDMLPERVSPDYPAIGLQNINSALSMFRQCGCKIKAHHVGGKGHRVVVMDVQSGDVWVKYRPGNVSQDK